VGHDFFPVSLSYFPRRLSENSIRGQELFENDHQISSNYFMKSDCLPQILPSGF
jgi:hypothetical protein